MCVQVSTGRRQCHGHHHPTIAARDSQACQPLLRLLRLPFQDLDDLLGDAVAESMAKIVAGVFDGDTDALFALMIDSSIDGFIRAR